MSVGGVPPRSGPPLTVQEHAPASEKPKDEKPAAIKDSIERAAAQKPTPKLANTLPVIEQDSGSHLQAFMALAAQVGEAPEGMRMAPAFEATLPGLETHVTMASLGFTPKQIAASVELMQLLRQGPTALSPEQETAVKERFATLTAPAQPPPLDPALLNLVNRFSGVFAGLAAKPERAKRKRVKAIDPDEVRELFDEAFEPEEEDDVFEFKKEADTLNIILPDLSVIALEQAWQEEWPKLDGHDPEALAELIMCHVAAANEGDMGKLLDALAQHPADTANADALVFYLERRAGFATMVRAMLKR